MKKAKNILTPMQQQIAEFIDRQPWRPFAIKLVNGSTYPITERREIGAPGNMHFVHVFQAQGVVRVETDAIKEIIES